MSANPSLELISFKVCPFVQRSVIALLEKQVDFKLTHIDLSDPPEWFKGISPLGKVPVLKVGEQPVFESAVILEYLDEVYAPKLHPDDALEKATHRAWVEFCSELITTQFKMLSAKDKDAFEENRNSLKEGLKRLEDVLAEEAPFFAGEKFSLVDTVYAPLFMRIKIVEAMRPLALDIPERIQMWSDALLARESVQNSVVDDFESIFMAFLKKLDGYVLK
ncbi:MAG: Glutathione S-transferase [uncultured Thiotrichaceae bacterium]|uniref:glutathione transferase n=1 Tax=uncultured Thiotrichaceae bacterium TaxID=298394 RepID=A0A6S6UD05_9GAMM|nr:MAG: Glutathione S-transferase [uncultured Thiotrichaceae bacterium]